MLRHRLASIAILVVAIMALMSPAFAEGSGERPPIKPGVQHDPEPEAPAERPSTLPFTGADVTAFALVGAATLGAGTLLLRRTRSRGAEQL